ncbi:MAG: MBL fold metallo-hydrolase [Chitinispirillia bacterium]|nr:MBL fold metallo-hydrolase [Chitinispirillia bacterium]MCL2241545.1 MBL fold metallo-hydrolase [Chitinispirillia bacterium]
MEVGSAKGDLVILDAGTGIRAFGDQFAEAPGKVIHLVFTHAHIDHLVGFPYFRPIFDDRTTLHIYGAPCGADSLETALRKFMRSPYFPVDFSALPCEIIFHEVSAAPFMIGALKLTPIRLNHPNGGCGYRIEERGAAFVFLTDNELEYGKPGGETDYFEAMCKGADLLMHDGEYTDKEYPLFESWGHSRYTDAVKLAVAAKVKRLGLFHINSRRTDKCMDAIVDDAKAIVKKCGAELECFGVGAGFEIELQSNTQYKMKASP